MRMVVVSMEFLKSTESVQCLQLVVFKARKFSIFGYWRENNSTTCKQPCSAQWRGSCMTRKSLQSLIIRQMDTVLLASGERLFRSRLCIPSSGHLLSSLSDEMALQQNPRLVHFGFPTASQRCNKEEKTFCSEAARGPNKCGTLISELWNYIIPVDLDFEFKDRKEDETVSSVKSLFISHTACGWVLPHIIISGSNLWLEKLGLMNYCVHLSKDVQEVSALLLHETGQRADLDRQTDG